MILHGLSVKNWRNIGALELSGLGRPIVVLYGPNRTGKSSLFAAIRSCLLDESFNTTGKGFTENIPWHSKLTPEVVVEFETGGERYKVRKRFSKNRDGEAVLERWLPQAGHWDVLQRGKEVDAELKSQILKLDKSCDGLNQLLWLDQGELHLPDEKKLNVSLQKRLEDVLGSLLTPRDWSFFEQLKKSAGRFFSESMGLRTAKDALLPAAEARVQRVEAELAELRRRWQLSEKLRQDYELAQETIRSCERDVELSRREVRDLEAELEASRDRRRLHEQARSQAEVAERQLAAAVKQWDQYQLVSRRAEAFASQMLGQEGGLQQLDLEVQGLDAELAEAQQRLQSAKQELEAFEATREELADQQRWIELQRRLTSLQPALQQAVALQQRIVEVQAQRGQVIAPTKVELDQLRKNRADAQGLRAVLSAHALQVSFTATGRIDIEATVDRGTQGEKLQSFEPGQTAHWEVGQRAEFSLRNVGVWRIQRGPAESELDESSKKLAELERAFADAVMGYGVERVDDMALELLEERRLLQLQLSEQFKNLNAELSRLTPEGLAALEMQIKQCALSREALLARRPALDQRELDAAAVEQGQRDFEQELKRRKRLIVTAEESNGAVKRRLDQVSQQRQKLRDEWTTLRAQNAAAEDEMQRLGQPELLQQGVDVARQQLEQARQQVQATTLSEQEQSIEQRLQGARQAHDLREDRYRKSVSRRDELYGELRGFEGLHERLCGAEAECEHASRELRDLQLEMESHRLLRQLFDACRESQVQRTTGVLGQRVLSWAKQLGLEDYQQVDFRNGYLPKALEREDAGAVEFGRESHGTTEQLALLVRLAVGGLLARDERQLAIFDDPLTHTDERKQRRMLEILEQAAAGSQGPGMHAGPTRLGPLQIVIFTCHPQRFDYLEAHRVNLESSILR